MNTNQHLTTYFNISKLFGKIETNEKRDKLFLFYQKKLICDFRLSHVFVATEYLIPYMNKYYHREIDFILTNSNILAFGTKSILSLKAPDGDNLTLMSSKFNYSPSSDYNSLDYSILPLFNMFQITNPSLFDEFLQKITNTIHKYLMFEELNMPITSEIAKLENVLKIIIAGYLPKFYVE